MCRYAMVSYKPHYACFACRRAFRRRLPEDIGHAGTSAPARCPECRGLVASMGLDFQPPKKSDRAAWQVLEALHEQGVTFHSCGCSGPGYRPREKRDLLAFFQELLPTYQAHLKRYETMKTQIEARQQERERGIAYWKERVNVLSKTLAETEKTS